MKCPSCAREMKSKIRDYEYRESGLNNVVLKSVTIHECPNCGEVLPEIPNVKQVHRWIAEYLVRKQSPLTGEEFRFLRKHMGMSANDLARVLGVTSVTISRWENNKENVGPQSDRLLRVVLCAGGLVSPIADRVRIADAITVSTHLLFDLLRGIAPRIAHRKPRPERILIPPLAQEKEKRPE